jgi:hypothetical protein
MKPPQASMPKPADLPERWRKMAAESSDTAYRHALRKCAVDLEFSLKMQKEGRGGR